jgi:hypothetical protein
MAIKTFTTGEILTASDTNTYLANSGLVYITKGTLSSTTTDFVGCFSSTYDNYRIVIDSLNPNSSSDLYWRMLTGSTPAATADYSWFTNGFLDSGVASTSNAAGQTLGYTGYTQTVGSFVGGTITMDVIGPNLNQRTFCHTQAIGYYGTFGNRGGGSHYNVVAQYTGIRFLTATAATITGNVTIYGYRKG